MEVLSLLFQIFTRETENNHLAVLINELKPTTIPNENKPDIFFVVFDEYASSKSLREDFNFDNSGMDSLFEANKFFVSCDSRSNYNFTSFSLASTFSMNILKLIQSPILSEKTLLQSVKVIKQSVFVNFLVREGYKILNYGCFDINDYPTQTFPFFDNEYLASTIDGQTIFARIKKDIWWNFTMKNIFTGEIRISDSYKLLKRSHLARNKINYEGLLREINTESRQPKFVYVHLMLPHAPFYLDANGGLNSDTSIILKNMNQKQAYLGQLNYANQLLYKTMRLINDFRYSRPRVYIIEGDHGYRYFNDLDAGDKPFMNLNAYYFSDGDYKQIYNGISPVNTFRVVLNKYFNTSLPLLSDSSTYIVDPR